MRRIGKQKKEFTLNLTWSNCSCQAQDCIKPPVEKWALELRLALVGVADILSSYTSILSLECWCASTLHPQAFSSLGCCVRCHHARLHDPDLTYFLTPLFLTKGFPLFRTLFCLLCHQACRLSRGVLLQETFPDPFIEYLTQSWSCKNGLLDPVFVPDSGLAFSKFGE